MADAQPEFVLLHSPLVGPASLRPTANALLERGCRCRLPSLLADNDRGVAAWSECPGGLREQLRGCVAPVLVGHSAAGLLAAALAAQLDAAGIVFLDAQIAPASGATAPVETDFMAFVTSLADAAGRLPRWADWWPGGLAHLQADAADLEAFFAELPRLDLDWFDATIDLPAWSSVAAGYLQTSSVFDAAAADAADRGWPVVRLDGTHLHPLLEPAATADALLELGARLRP